MPRSSSSACIADWYGATHWPPSSLASPPISVFQTRPADPVARLEHDDVHSLAGEGRRGREPGDPRPDDNYLGLDAALRHPAFPPAGRWRPV